MDFLQSITRIVFYGTVTTSLLLFFVSFLLLVLGIAIKVWLEAVKLKGMDRKSLAWIERTHPHLPSLRGVLMINLCVFTLLMVGLQSLRGVFPFNDPYQGLNLVTLFVLAAALGTLGELRWKTAQSYSFAFILGTASAFLFLSLLYATAQTSFLEWMLMGLSGILFVLFTWNMLGKMPKDRNWLFAALVTLAVFMFWFLIYTLQ